MDKAKAAVHDFMSKSGRHDTTVHEKVAPAVTKETVQPQRHENVTTAVDKEVHQDHYHTAVQPVHDKETLPEKHHHNLADVEHRQVEHGNHRDVADRLQREAAQFKNESVTAPTHETHATAPTIAGEHVHHHVHETIQPVVQKETIQPHVVHTTVPIHEVHHNAAQHHAASALPAVSMADFKKQGGTLGGREERYDGFEGEPRSIGTSSLGGHGTSQGQMSANRSGVEGYPHGAARDPMSANYQRHDGTSSGSYGTSNQYNSPNEGGAFSSGNHNQSKVQSSSNSAGSEGGLGSGCTSNDNAPSSQAKPSVMQKLNPKVDSDGDGKAGFMK